MLEWIRGTLARRDHGFVVVDMGGIGVRVEMSAASIDALPESPAEVTVPLSLIIQDTEPRIRLFGFSSEAEKVLFSLLRGVQGIGAALALRVVSAGPVAELVVAIRSGDLQRLSAVKGLGPKRAERLVTELRDKLAAHPLLGALAAADTGGSPQEGKRGRGRRTPRGRGRVARTAEVLAEVASDGLGPASEEALKALVRLELEPDEARVLLQRAHGKLGADASSEDLVRECLGSS